MNTIGTNAEAGIEHQSLSVLREDVAEQFPTLGKPLIAYIGAMASGCTVDVCRVASRMSEMGSMV